MTRTVIAGTAIAVCLLLPGAASALERICDPAYEDCRDPLIQLIDNESTSIDVAFWFMEDARYSAALARAAARQVRIRVLFDSEELDPNNSSLETRQIIVDQIRNARIPMIDKVSPGINHWKMMLFGSQNTVEFTGANFTGEAYVFQEAYKDYVDEVIYFTERQSIVDSFKTAFDDVWTNVQDYADYANITTPRTRAYPTFPIDPEMQFHLYFRERSVEVYNAEPTEIDAIIYRITDRAHTDALIEAVKRGVKIRLISEPHQYSDPTRLWHRWNIDRLYMAGLAHPIGGEPGVQIRHRAHLGLTHEKLTILQGQNMAVFGSSNWTSASSDYQLEHNMFTKDPAFVAWSRTHFERKWNNLAPDGEIETVPFAPLGPDMPQLGSPANGAAGQPVATTLQWYGGYWAHKYDVYIGTSPGSMVRVLTDEELGPEYQSFNVPGLTGGTTYYWKIVGRTMANLDAASPTWSFTTAGVPTNNAPPTVTLTAPSSGASYTSPATIALAASAFDSDGTVAQVDFYNGTTHIGSDTTSPYTSTWSNVPAGTYSLTARAVDNAGATTTSGAVTVTVSAGTPTPLPAPWAQQDIGGVGAAGGGSVSGGTWTVTGSGADVWDTADQFHYVYAPVTGDVTIVARVAAIDNVDQWTKAGVMIRESLAPGSAHGFMIVTPAGVKGLAFQRRTGTNGISTHTAGGSGLPPVWVRLTRTGTTIAAYRSGDGVTWTPVGSDTIPMGGPVFVGLAVSSHNNGVLASATFDNVTVTPAGGGPPPPNAPPSVTLTAPAAGATFTAPAQIALSANASDSDGTVSRVEFYSGSTLIGTDSTSPYTATWNSVGPGTYSVTARAIDNADAATSSSAATVTVNGSAPPHLPAPWSQQDIGGVSAAGSGGLNGGTWTVSGSGADVWDTADQFHFVYQTLTGDGSIVARVASVENVDSWTKAGVMIRESLAPGSAHAFMIVTPGGVKGLAFQRRTATNGISTHTSGGAGTAPAWVRLTRSGSSVTASRSADGVNWTPIASDMIPMASTVNIGLAITSHNNGVLASATFDNVNVIPSGSGAQPPPNVPPTIAFTSPADGETLTAPATITFTANASDSDGSIAHVDFYSGTTLIGSDSTSPYALTWSNVPAGTYHFTARATDNAGAETTSGEAVVQVNGASPPSGTLPPDWSHGDIGTVGVAGNASASGGTFTISGSGADIWGTSDSFQFAYRTMTGDGTIVARVDSIQAAHDWTKAGVMIRAGLTPDSAHAMMVVSAAKGLAFQRRVATGGLSVHTAGSAGTAPAWVRLQRSGSVISASTSSDGVNWTPVGTDTIPMPVTVYVGLPITSHADGAVATAVISNVSVTP